MGAYFYAIFSMIAAGVFLPTLDTKTIMVFAQSALLFIQVTFQGKPLSLTVCFDLPLTYRGPIGTGVMGAYCLGTCEDRVTGASHP